MGKPKHRTTPRATGMRRSHMVEKLARRVNAKSPVKVGAKPAKDDSKAKTS